MNTKLNRKDKATKGVLAEKINLIINMVLQTKSPKFIAIKYRACPSMFLSLLLNLVYCLDHTEAAGGPAIGAVSRGGE